MFQWELAELTIWVAIKSLDFYLWLDRLGLLITSVHFPGNAGMCPYADSFWVQRAQNPLQRVETAKAKTLKTREGEKQRGQHMQSSSGLIIYRQFAGSQKREGLGGQA